LASVNAVSLSTEESVTLSGSPVSGALTVGDGTLTIGTPSATQVTATNVLGDTETDLVKFKLSAANEGMIVDRLGLRFVASTGTASLKDLKILDGETVVATYPAVEAVADLGTVVAVPLSTPVEIPAGDSKTFVVKGQLDDDQVLTGVTVTGSVVSGVKLTLATVADGETLVINGFTFTAEDVIGNVTVADREFTIEGNDTADATALEGILTDATYGVPGLTVVQDGATITLFAPIVQISGTATVTTTITPTYNLALGSNTITRAKGALSSSTVLASGAITTGVGALTKVNALATVSLNASSPTGAITLQPKTLLATVDIKAEGGDITLPAAAITARFTGTNVLAADYLDEVDEVLMYQGSSLTDATPANLVIGNAVGAGVDGNMSATLTPASAITILSGTTESFIFVYDLTNDGNPWVSATDETVALTLSGFALTDGTTAVWETTDSISGNSLSF
jgi:hypothetical protein